MLFVILMLRLSDALPTVRGCFLERHQVVRSVDSASGQRQYYFVHRGATALLESKKCSCDAESRCAFRLKPDGKGHSVASFTPLSRDQLVDVVDNNHSRAKGRRTVAMTTHHEMSNGNATVQIVCNGRWVQNGRACHNRSRCPLVVDSKTLGKMGGKVTVVEVKAADAMFECHSNLHIHQHLVTVHTKQQTLEETDCENDSQGCPLQKTQTLCDKKCIYGDCFWHLGTQRAMCKCIRGFRGDFCAQRSFQGHFRRRRHGSRHQQRV